MSPRDYEMAVKRIAIRMAQCRKLEKGGKIRSGWFEARMALMDQVAKECERFPGMDFDLVDDAAVLIASLAREARNRHEGEVDPAE